MTKPQIDLEALSKITMPLTLMYANPALVQNMSRIDEIAVTLEFAGVTKEQIETIFQKIGYQAVIPERWHAETYWWERQQMEWVLERVKIGVKIEHVIARLS
jgi:hypothetical protein